MRILFIGDIVGKPGREIVGSGVPFLRDQRQVDFVIANAENAAGGSGITPAIYRELTSCGVDAITLGDHIYRRKAIVPILQSRENIVRPANYPPEAPGKELAVVNSANGIPVAVISLMGRVFMRPVDCPFQAVERVLANIPSDVRVVFVDMHAEATSDKQLMGRYLDGRVSVVLGTHTHVATADEQILPSGTAFQCDVGMTGPHDSILGRQIDRVQHTTLTFEPTAFDVATDDVRLCGAIVDIDEQSGKAVAIERVCLRESELPQNRQADAIKVTK